MRDLDQITTRKQLLASLDVTAAYELADAALRIAEAYGSSLNPDNDDIVMEATDSIHRTLVRQGVPGIMDIEPGEDLAFWVRLDAN